MRRVLLIGVLAILLAACGGSTASLAGPTWTVTAMPGVDVQPTVTITALFGSDGMVSGSGGCNNYSAAYTVNGSSLTIQAPAATMMSCSEEINQQESDYFFLLEDAGAYEIKGDTLTIKDSDGQALLEYTSQ